MDYGALPPEINSARIYTGPGAGSMATAAAAWQILSLELYAAGDSFRAVIASLTAGPWLGASEAAMVAAALPYVAWIDATAAQVEATAGAARAAAASYETALAMSVPPPVIAENRSRLMGLAATNVFGQNTPAIALAELEYSEMWGQDAMAMYSYASAARQATANLPAFQAAPEIAEPRALSGQVAAPGPIAEASLPADVATAIPGPLPSAGELLSMGSLRISDAAMVISGVAPALLGTSASGATGSASEEDPVDDDVAQQPFVIGLSTSPVPTALSGQADPIGRLSVPPSWVQKNQVVAPPAPLAPGPTMADAAEGAPQQVLGGVPLANLASASDRTGVSGVLQISPRAYAIPRTPAAG